MTDTQRDARPWYLEAFDSEAWRRLHEAYWTPEAVELSRETISERLALSDLSLGKLASLSEQPSDVTAPGMGPDAAVAAQSAPQPPAKLRLLDVPCGTGAIAESFSRLGHEVVGVDANETLLAQAEARCAGLEVTLINGDMRELPKDESFDAAFCWWGSFAYLGEAGDAEFLRAVAASLKDGGRFLVDTWTLEGLLPLFERTGVRMLGSEIEWRETREYDLDKGTLSSRSEVFEGGTSLGAFETEMRLYAAFELRRLLLRAGFSKVQHLSHLGEAASFSGEGFRSHFVATK